MSFGVSRALVYGLGVVALLGWGCGFDLAILAPNGQTGADLRDARFAPPPAEGYRLIARLAHLTDVHITDIASPARFTGADPIVPPAWRPQEAYAAHVLDGLVRTLNRMHIAGRAIDALVVTGDLVDNAQANELAWFLAVMDGDLVRPLSGPDDRPAASRPPAELDPFAPFQAQGLYQRGRHGPLPSIPWYAAVGNHDVYALGVFPILTVADGRRLAPLPLPLRPGLWLPVVLDPTGDRAYGVVSPAGPGPPPLFNCPQTVPADPGRAYVTRADIADALSATRSEPAGHGLPPGGDVTWYSVPVAVGVRLIVLDTTRARGVVAGAIQSEGALSRAQLDFLRAELRDVEHAGELAVVATHHPSDALRTESGSEVGPWEFRSVLRSSPAVVVHLAGHTHRHRVTDRGSYLEIETAAGVDWPQEGRIVELWVNEQDGRVTIAYDTFTHVTDEWPVLGDDPLRDLRERARLLARSDKQPLRPQISEPK